ncbi:MAG: BspA family leucine-rich repeat surface protein, partial [Turicibacter sp.]|nr:BspA family leucine-rich repeat surface protein [Turicibacter sp.]
MKNLLKSMLSIMIAIAVFTATFTAPVTVQGTFAEVQTVVGMSNDSEFDEEIDLEEIDSEEEEEEKTEQPGEEEPEEPSDTEESEDDTEQPDDTDEDNPEEVEEPDDTDESDPENPDDTDTDEFDEEDLEEDEDEDEPVVFVPADLPVVPFNTVVASGQFGVDTGFIGFTGGSAWRLYDNGTLVVDSGGVDLPFLGSSTGSPWSSHQSAIQRIIFTGPITTGLSLVNLFSGLSQLQEIQGLEYFDTSSLMFTSFMFSSTSSLTSLNLSSFDTRNALGMDSMIFMFGGTTALTHLTLGPNFQFAVYGAGNLPAATWVNQGTGTLERPQANRTYTSAELMQNPGGPGGLNDTWIRLDSLPPDWDSIPPSTRNITAQGQFGVDTGTIGFTGGSHWRLYNDGILEVDSGIISTNVRVGIEEVTPWYEHINEIQRIIFNGTITAGANLTALFARLTQLQEIEGLTHFDTSNVTTMWRMFDGASSLTSLDLSSFDTSNVTSMSFMFNNANSLTSLDLSSFDTSMVQGMTNMFNGTYNLTSLDLSSFDTTRMGFASMQGMFTTALIHLTLGLNFQFTTGNVGGNPNPPMLNATWTNLGNGELTNPQGNRTYTSAQLMALPMGDLNDTWIRTDSLNSGSNTGNIIAQGQFGVDTGTIGFTGGSHWRLYNDGTLEVDGGIVTSTLQLSSPWDTYSSNIQKIVFNGPVIVGANSLGTRSLTNFFSNLPHLQEIVGLTHFHTHNVVTMTRMFQGASSLTSLDLSSFNTSNVTSMATMFQGANSLTSLNLSSFDTGRMVQWIGPNSTGSMFAGTTTLNQLTLGPDFRFGTSAGLPPATWTNLGNGELDNPQGNRTYTSAELMALFSGLNDTWIRVDSIGTHPEPTPTPTPTPPPTPPSITDPPTPQTAPHPTDITTINQIIT